MYSYGPTSRSSADQAEAALAAAQLLANDRNPRREEPSQRDLLYASGVNALNQAQFNPQLFSQGNPSRLAASNPFLAQAGQALPQFPPPQSQVADPQAMLRAQAAAAVLLQQQQEAAQLQALKHASMFADAHRFSGLISKNPLDTRMSAAFANTPLFNTSVVGGGISNIPPALLRTLENAEVNDEEIESRMEEAKEIRTKKMEEDALEFLGATTREAKNGLYFDASVLRDPEPALFSGRRTRGGVTEPFPEKVHRMLTDAEKEDNEDILSWYPHGRAFGIHDQDRFVKEILPRYVCSRQYVVFFRLM